MQRVVLLTGGPAASTFAAFPGGSVTELAAPQISSLMEALPGIAAVLRNPVANAMVAMSRAAAGLEEFELTDAEELLHFGVRRNLLTPEEVDAVLIDLRAVVALRPPRPAPPPVKKPAKPEGPKPPHRPKGIQLKPGPRRPPPPPPPPPKPPEAAPARKAAAKPVVAHKAPAHKPVAHKPAAHHAAPHKTASARKSAAKSASAKATKGHSARTGSRAKPAAKAAKKRAKHR